LTFPAEVTRRVYLEVALVEMGSVVHRIQSNTSPKAAKTGKGGAEQA
jgi:hypothetical protein